MSSQVWAGVVYAEDPVAGGWEESAADEVAVVADGSTVADEVTAIKDGISVEVERVSDEEEIMSAGGDESVVDDPVMEVPVVEAELTDPDALSVPVNITQTEAKDDKKAVVGGYIEMPWDNDTPSVNRALSYDDAIENIVEEPGDKNGRREYEPELDKYVSTPVSLERKYPAESDAAIFEYLNESFPATRSQAPYGSCWAHTAMSLAEFYMISHNLTDVAGPVNNSVDYSELQLAYFCYHNAPDSLIKDTGDSVTFKPQVGEKKSFLDFGGNLNLASQSLMRYRGVVNDAGDAAYSNAENVISNGLSNEYSSSLNTAYLKNEYQLNIRQNPELVKQAIKENGIVGVSIFADDSYMNFETNSYYTSKTQNTNHAVALVGWDDDYPASKFKSTPASNGAWLVRNSWSTITEFSFYSYFWLSYEDKGLKDTAYVFEMADMENGEVFDNNYYYDSQLHNVAVADTAKAANVFTGIKSFETLKAVQIDSTLNIPGNYKIEIYKNLTDLSNPESGTKMNTATTEGNLPFSGKYTIPLNDGVDISEGETFSIVVSTQLPIDQESDKILETQLVMDTNIHACESFIYENAAWKDLVNLTYGGKYGNLCIRALTDTKDDSAAPDHVTSLVVGAHNEQSISLMWSAARGAEGYEVWFSDSENGTYSLAGATQAGVRSFKHSGLTAATTYYYKVYPMLNGRRYEAGVSPVISAATAMMIPNVEIVKTGRYSANVRWDALESCDGYEYRYGQDYFTYEKQTTSENEVRLLGLDPGTECWIEVKAYTLNGEDKNYSEASKVTFTTKSGTGSAVTDLRGEPILVTEMSTEYVRLFWNAPDDEAFYRVEVSTDNENFTTVYDLISDTDPPVKLTGPEDALYYFRVTAIYFRAGFEIDPFEAPTISMYRILPAVTLSEVYNMGESIYIEWDGVSAANYYSVYRKEYSASEFVPLGLVTADNTRFIDDTVLPGRIYSYRVYGCMTNELSDKQSYCKEEATVTIYLDKITDLKASDITKKSARLSWSAIKGAQGYAICYFDDDESVNDFVELDTVDSNTTSYTVEGLYPDTYYEFAVVAFTDCMDGEADALRFTTSPPDPADADLFTVTGTTAVYDGKGHEVTVTCSESEIAEAGYEVYYGRIVDGVVPSYSKNEPVDAGVYQVMVQTAASTYYTATELADDDWKLTISPKTVGLTWTDLSFTYDKSSHKPSATATGLVAGDECLVTVDGEQTEAGDHTATATKLSDPNYALPAAATKAFSIAKAASEDKTAEGSVKYGMSGTVGLGALIPGYCSIKFDGVMTQDNDSILASAVDITDNTLSFSFKNTPTAAGKSAVVTVPVDGGRNYEDYDITVTLTALSRLSFDSVTDGKVYKTYGDADFTLTATADEGDVTYTSSDETIATIGATDGKVHILKAGEVAITATAAETEEYPEESQDCLLIIERRSVEGAAITLDHPELLFNGNEQSVNVTGVVLANNMVLDETDYEVSGNTGEGVNTYTLTVTGKGNFTGSANVNWSICPARMMVSASDVKVKYNGYGHGIAVNVSEPAGGYTISYGLSEDNIGSSESPLITDAGSLRIYYKVSAENYAETKGSAVVTVDKADAFVVAPSANTAVYNGQTRLLITQGHSDDGTIEYSTDNSTWNRIVPAAKNAGAYDVWWRLTGNKNHNDIAAVKLTGKIEQEKLTVTPEQNKSKVYGDSDPGLAYTVTGFVGDDTASVIKGALGRTAGENVGEYEILPGTLSADNYRIEVSSGVKFTVRQRPVTVKADDKTKKEGEAEPGFTATVSGLKEGDSDKLIRYSFVREAGESAGTYAINVSGDKDQGNYTVTYEPGVLTITEDRKDDPSSGSGSSSSDKDSTSSDPGRDSTTSSSDKDEGSSSSEKDTGSSSSEKDAGSSSSGKDPGSSSSEKKEEVTVTTESVDGTEVKTAVFNNDVAVKQKIDASSYLGIHKKYVVSPKGAAKVDKKTRTITLKKPGDITITAYDKDGKIWVMKEVIKLKADLSVVKVKTVNATAGGEAIDGASNIEDSVLVPDKWESSKPSVASVDEKTGFITPLAKGKATITAYYGSGKNAAKVKFKVKVVE